MRQILLSVSLVGLFGLLGCKYTAGICDCMYRDECHLKAPWVYRAAVPPPVQPAGYHGAYQGPYSGGAQPGPVLIEEKGPAVRDLPMQQ